MSFYQSVAERRLQPEWMDQPDLSDGWHRQALRGLGRINSWSGAAQRLWVPILKQQQELQRPMRVLDLACGGGDVICRLARRARQSRVDVKFEGCDKSPTAIEFAKQNAHRLNVTSDFFVADVMAENVPSGFDVVMSSLFLHHLTNIQAKNLLRKMAEATDHLVLINDLIRSKAGWMLAQLGTRILSFSAIVHHDGPRSVEGAFTSGEIAQIAVAAGLEDAEITKCWPQRFLLSWRKPG